MPSNYLDRYGRAASMCHRWPPKLKLLLTLAVVFTVISVPIRFWPLHGVFLSVVFIGHSLARIPLVYVARRLAVFLPMLIMLSFSVPISQGFQAGWELAASILVRGTTAFLCGLWLVNVMPFDQLLSTLRRLGIPAILVSMLAFMYRYFFVLWDELDKMRTARRARTFCHQTFWQRWKGSAQLIGMLLIRAMQRAERVHGAMCARGWDGHVRFLDDARSHSARSQQ